jgi:tetratricopeptide (TPR) repeat protein
MPVIRQSNPLRPSFYRAIFWAGVGVVGLSVAVGLVAPLLSGGSVPGLGSDGLIQARQLEAAGDLPRAFAQYRTAAILQGGAASYPFSFAQALLRHRRLEDADVWFRAASRIDPTLASAHAGLGEIALDELRLDDAARYFGQALRLEPGNPRFHHGLGVTQALRGQYAEAIVEFEAAARLGGGPATMKNLQRARQDAARAENRP